MENTLGKKQRTISPLLYLIVVALLGALSTLVMLLKVPLPFAPGFYKLDVSEAIVLTGSFALGPVAGMLIELIKVLMNLLMDGTTTAGIGELSNFIMGCSLVVPAALIYKQKKTWKSALLGCVVGWVSLIVVSALLNYFLLFPAYINLMGLSADKIVGMSNAVNSAIDSLTKVIFYATVPFNALKGALASLIAMLLYPRLAHIIMRFNGGREKKVEAA
ncbi:MAG: ECF transporter S component [Christensenellaceae bacterium]